MTAVVTQPCASAASKQHFKDTIETPVVIQQHAAKLDPAVLRELLVLFPDGLVPMWGVTPGRRNVNVGKYARAQKGDAVVFAADNEFFAAGAIAFKLRNPGLARVLWGETEDGQTWEYMYALDDIRPVGVPYRTFGEAVGYLEGWVPQGFNVLDDDRSRRAMAAFGLHSDRQPAAVQPDEFAEAVRRFDGEVDAAAVAQRRLEQDFIRSALMPTSVGRCHLCGESFPREFLVAAHIKKRAVCSFEEKTDIPSIAMAACAFGCDDLFERGYLTVDADGVVRGAPDGLPEGTVARARVRELEGRRFGGEMGPRASYFQWHRENTFRD